jgi:ATP-dependent DNA helicase PIF1
VLVIAPTGTAAFNIDGYTIHSALEIPCNQNLSKYKDLSSKQKNSLETTLGDVRLIIHDEISLTGRTMFNYINSRMQDIKNKKTKLFGGVHYLAVGDLFQIKAPFDRYVFEDLDSDYDPLCSNF